MKKCKDCGLDKPDFDYYGKQNECKECTKARVKRNSERVGSAYDFSEKGVFRVIYKTQKRHQRLRGHGDMPYTKQDLVVWCKENGFDLIFNAWVQSGYDSNLKPSIDRIDDFKGYSLDNIRLGTWRENRNHQAQDIINGTGTSGKRCKPVGKYDSDWNLVCKYPSYQSAKRDIGYKLEYQIKKSVMCRNGFYWRYI